MPLKGIILFFLFLFLLVESDDKQTIKKNEKLPLIFFVGDSITNGKPTGQPEYKPTAPNEFPQLKEGSYGYFEALVEATRGKTIPFRLDKFGSGGQSIVNSLGTVSRQILESRYNGLNEMPAMLIIQDYVSGKSENIDAIETALRNMNAQAIKAGKIQLVWSTVVTDPKGSSGLKYSDEEVKTVNELIIKVSKELNVPVIRLDIAWARYIDYTKNKNPEKDWVLTRTVSASDGVHLGKVGSLFQALIFARELGIPYKEFDETVAALALPKEQSKEIKDLVYSWKEPPVALIK
jgi:hypothetical protein